MNGSKGVLGYSPSLKMLIGDNYPRYFIGIYDESHFSDSPSTTRLIVDPINNIMVIY